MTDERNPFADLLKIDVSRHVEKKNGHSYLSWAYALAEVLKADPAATWRVERFPGEGGAMLPYLHTPLGYVVEVNVTVHGVTRGQIHPVIDNRNKVIGTPTVFEINTSIQRCLVKAIAQHGLGLYVYAGEDLPTALDDEPAPARRPARKAEPSDERATIDDEAFSAWLGVAAHITDSDELGKHFSVLRKYRLTRAQVDAASACKTAREAAIAKAPAKKEQAHAAPQQ
jgi:hypothetical protein